MMAVTALCAAAATEAAAQDGPIVLNQQLQLGDVIAGVTLNVEDAEGEVAVNNAAQGVVLSGAVEGTSLGLTSSQTMRGNTLATTAVVLTGEAQGPVNLETQARGNGLAAGAYGGDLTIESSQIVGPSEVAAAASLTGPAPRLLGGASISTTSVANTASLGASGSVVRGVLIQGSEAGVRSDTLVQTQYIPAEAEVIGQSVANTVTVNSDGVSAQDLTIRQRQAGDIVTASVSANAGNAWDLAGRARATANQSLLYNQGGSVVVVTDQSNLSQIQASSVVTSYDFGAATSHAAATANQVSIGNNGSYVQIDNSQVNSGGVEATARFEGTNGYDTYVAAEATGNAVTGYVCSQCEAQLVTDNIQTNSGSVSALATTTIRGGGRSVTTGANAVGNSATFYASRPGS